MFCRQWKFLTAGMAIYQVFITLFNTCPVVPVAMFDLTFKMSFAIHFVGFEGLVFQEHQ